MVVKNVPQFNYFWERTMIKYRNYFENQVFSLYFRESMYDYSFLLQNDMIEKSDRNKVDVFGGEKQVEIDDLDYKILKIITPNARMPMNEIAQKLNSTADRVNNRIKKLIKKGVIIEYKVNIDFPKLGYKLHKTDINLKEPKKRDKILEYLERNPHLYHIIQSMGYADIELLFYLENTDQLHEIMADISVRFPDAIKNYTYFSTIKTHKWNYLPEK
jgi:Lrp/AsnC family leucine-responsive transcriptional regulator